MTDPLNINDLINGKQDLETIAEVAMVGTLADTTINRQGVQVDTIEGRLKKIGFAPPLAYAAGITFTGPLDAVKTVDNGGIIYGCLASARPFTTTGNFANDVASFFVVQDGNQAVGDVRTDTSNTYQAGTTQSFDTATANTFNLDGQDLGDKLQEIDGNTLATQAAQKYINSISRRGVNNVEFTVEETEGVGTCYLITNGEEVKYILSGSDSYIFKAGIFLEARTGSENMTINFNFRADTDGVAGNLYGSYGLGRKRPSESIVGVGTRVFSSTGTDNIESLVTPDINVTSEDVFSNFDFIVSAQSPEDEITITLSVDDVSGDLSDITIFSEVNRAVNI